MVARRFDCRWFAMARRYMWAVVFMGPSIACAQFGGGGGGAAPDPTVEQRLYPNGLPKMELMLKAALEHHPEVLAARSKVRSAEAELRLVELKSLKDVMAVRDRWEKANQKIVNQKPTDTPEVTREMLANVAAIEWELSFLLGTRGDILAGQSGTERAEVPGSPIAASKASAASVALESLIPSGKRGELIKSKLHEEVSVNFENQSLKKVTVELQKMTGVTFLLDEVGLEAGGVPVDWPITGTFEKTEFSTMLQALQDVHPPLYFVVRDYGILVTSTNKRSSKFVSAIDFAKLDYMELKELIRQQHMEETTGGGGTGGGGTGGGFF